MSQVGWTETEGCESVHEAGRGLRARLVTIGAIDSVGVVGPGTQRRLVI
jgi:hypothetical protein